MRVMAATGIAIGLAAIAGAAEAREASIYRGKCGEVVLPQGPSGLDAAIRVDTSCGAFAIDRRGVRQVGRRRARPSMEGVVWARGRFVARTRAGLLMSWWGTTLTVRHPSGRVVGRFTTARGVRFDPFTRTVLFVSPRNALVRTDGRLVTPLSSLERLGLGRAHEIVPLEEGRVALLGRRLVVLGSDGSVVASDRRRGALSVLSSRGAIALISTGRLDSRGRARESVRLLRPGGRSSTLLYANEVGALGCGHWPSLEWRGEKILYSTSAGDVVVIDAASRHHRDLTMLVRQLPGDFVQARWA
jgi:hypothetical protein